MRLLPSTLFLVMVYGAASCGTSVLDPIQGTPNTSDIDVLAHWNFDEGTGVLIKDASQHRHDGMLIGGGPSSWAAGQMGFGHALYLKRGDHVTVSNFPPATPSWTVSLWVRFAPGDLANGRSPLIGNEFNNEGWEVNAPDASNPPNLEFAYPAMTGGGNQNHIHVVCCQPPAIDRWIHVTAVLDGNLNTLTIYEGRMIGQVNRMIQSLILPGNPTLTMGTANNMGVPNNSGFQGTIDEIRIYTRALTFAEISDLTTKP